MKRQPLTLNKQYRWAGGEVQEKTRRIITFSLLFVGFIALAGLACFAWARAWKTVPNESAAPGEKKMTESQKRTCPVAISRYTFYTSRGLRTVLIIGARGKTVMLSSIAVDVDLIEELRLRRWAREHYVPRHQREISWHPVILDEMHRKDGEMAEVEPVFTCA